MAAVPSTASVKVSWPGGPEVSSRSTSEKISLICLMAAAMREPLRTRNSASFMCSA
jgi:hypothetical protein